MNVGFGWTFTVPDRRKGKELLPSVGTSNAQLEVDPEPPCWEHRTRYLQNMPQRDYTTILR
jgi:hypothetical protein